MSVRDNFAAGKYENKVPWTVEVIPVDEDTMTVKQARAHKESERDRVREQHQKHRKEDGRLAALLCCDLEAEHGLTGHPKAGALWEKAWDRGHSGGYEDIISVYEDLAELLTVGSPLTSAQRPEGQS